MATATLSEANTVPSSSFIENLFINLPTDSRFKQVVTHKFVPRTGLDVNSTQIEFLLPALDSPNCYFISNIMIEVTILITKADNSLPPATAQVAPVCNMLSSLFETVNLRINDNLITASGSQYSYKDYLQTLISTPSDARVLFTSKGFIFDQPYDNDSVTANIGFLNRGTYFRKGRTTTGEFRPEGATFIGKLNHDLSSSNNRILPPGTKVDFTLTRTSDKFYLMCLETDKEEYKAKILSCVLYCPIGIMSDRLTNEIYAKWQSMPIKYFFNRLVVKSLTMPLSKAEFLSDNLFSDSESPSRIFVVIVESSAILGNYAKSPFTFKRSWQVIGGMLDNAQMALQSENNYLKSSLDDLKSQMSTLVTMLQSQQNSLPNNQRNQESDSENESLTAKRNSRRKGKKLLKKQKTTNSDRQSTSFLGRIYNTFQNTDGNSDPDGMSDLQSVNEMEARPSDLGLGLRGTTTDYWIESLELELMSAPLDQLRSRSSQDEAMADYIRLQRTLNQFNQVFSSAISYEHFLRGAYIGAFDLTSNAQPGLAYAINTVRTGNFF